MLVTESTLILTYLMSCRFQGFPPLKFQRLLQEMVPSMHRLSLLLLCSCSRVVCSHSQGSSAPSHPPGTLLFCQKSHQGCTGTWVHTHCSATQLVQ